MLIGVCVGEFLGPLKHGSGTSSLIFMAAQEQYPQRTPMPATFHYLHPTPPFHPQALSMLQYENVENRNDEKKNTKGKAEKQKSSSCCQVVGVFCANESRAASKGQGKVARKEREGRGESRGGPTKVELHWVSLCLPALLLPLSLCVSVCVCGLITFCFRCLSVHAQRPRSNQPPLLSPFRIELLKASTHFYVCSPGWRSLFFIALRSAAKPFFHPHLTLPPSSLTETIVDSPVRVGRGVGGKNCNFCEEKAKKTSWKTV